MFAKIRKGEGFGGCLDYITRVKQDNQPKAKRIWSILGSDGVRLDVDSDGWRKKASQDIGRPTLTRRKIKDPCGHISLNFSSNDSERMTDDFMLKLAHEYMEKMEIKNTPYVIVRHKDKEHPHCHIMFSRVDYDGKIIKPVTNLYRNRQVCLDITKKYNLTMGSDKFSGDPRNLRGSERSRYEIAQAINAVLKDPAVTSWKAFFGELSGHGISVKPIYGEDKRLETIIYSKGRHSFKASKIDRKFTLFQLQKEFDRRRETARREHMANTPDPRNQWIHLDGSPIAPVEFNGVMITAEQQNDYLKGRTIRVDGHYIRFDFGTRQPQITPFNPDIFSDRGNGLPFYPGADPEYSAFYSGLGKFDKEEFRRFRRRHPALTNEEAMRLFKLNHGHSQMLGHHL